jgi:ubiquinone/menaquinone biosynthesis C-methylase UbiE
MNTPPDVNPVRIFTMMTAYQQSAALKAAVELGLFTAMAEGRKTAAELAAATGSAERGIRILADYWTVHGLLEKTEGGYGLTPESQLFLNQQSPAYMGGMVGFLGAPGIVRQFSTLTDAVRRGGVASDEAGSTAEEYGGWVDFANSMMAMMAPAAQQIAALVNDPPRQPLAVLDVAASHGMFGFMIAQQNPLARITALDWPNVLEVTKANAAKWGLGERFSTIAGDAFAVDLEGPYDVILLTNLLHHFDAPTNIRLLKRMKAALKPGGKAVTLEFVPNDDRISPPMPATFSLVMLASTPAGDAYTFAEFERMFNEAGFTSSSQSQVQGTPQTIIVSQ